MADPAAVRFLEGIYGRVDRMVREIMATLPAGVEAMAINIQMDGGGAALVAGISGQFEIPTSGRLIGARMFVGPEDSASSATVAVGIGTYEDYPTATSGSLEGTGTIPTLTSAVKAEMDTAGWFQNIYARDILVWQLASFSGTAQHLTLSLLYRKTSTIRPAAA